jgi:hypothetical protein
MGFHFHASATFPLEKSKRYLVNMVEAGPQKGSGRLGVDKNFVSLLRIEIHFSSSASRLLNIPGLLSFVLLFLSKDAENFVKQKNHTKSNTM